MASCALSSVWPATKFRGLQRHEAVVFALGGRFCTCSQVDLRRRLVLRRPRRLRDVQPGLGVLQPGQHLALLHLVAFLDIDLLTTPEVRAATWMMPPSTSALPLAMAA